MAESPGLKDLNLSPHGFNKTTIYYHYWWTDEYVKRGGFATAGAEHEPYSLNFALFLLLPSVVLFFFMAVGGGLVPSLLPCKRAKGSSPAERKQQWRAIKAMQYPPFEERSAGLSFMTIVGGFSWCFATLATDDAAPQWFWDEAGALSSGGAAASRLDWGLWRGYVRQVGRFALWSNCLLIRLHALRSLYVNDEEPVCRVITNAMYMVPWIVGVYVAVGYPQHASLFAVPAGLTAFFLATGLRHEAPVLRVGKRQQPEVWREAMLTVVPLALAYALNLWVCYEERGRTKAGPSEWRLAMPSVVVPLLVVTHFYSTHAYLIFKFFTQSRDPDFVAKYLSAGQDDADGGVEATRAHLANVTAAKEKGERKAARAKAKAQRAAGNKVHPGVAGKYAADSGTDSDEEEGGLSKEEKLAAKIAEMEAAVKTQEAEEADAENWIVDVITGERRRKRR